MCVYLMFYPALTFLIIEHAGLFNISMFGVWIIVLVIKARQTFFIPLYGLERESEEIMSTYSLTQAN